MALAQVIHICDEFVGGRAWSGTTADTNGWNIRTVGSGSPTATALNNTSSGKVRLACDNTTASQGLVLSDNDVLWFQSYNQTSPNQTGLKLFQAVCTFNNVDTNTNAFIGVANAHNATLTSITARVGFNIGASGEVTIDCVNSTVSNSAIDTLYALTAGDDYLFEINFANPKDVRFMITNINNFNAFTVGRTAASTTFDFSAYTGSLQRYLRIGKSGGTNTTSMDVDRVNVSLKRK